MSIKTNKTLKLSDKSTGIDPIETPVYTINGVKQKVMDIEILISSKNNSITLTGNLVYLDSNEKVLPQQPFKKVFIARDRGEVGTVELNEDGSEKEGTYVKIKDEDLVITNWNKQLGDIVIPPAILRVEEEMGWK